MNGPRYRTFIWYESINNKVKREYAWVQSSFRAWPSGCSDCHDHEVPQSCALVSYSTHHLNLRSARSGRWTTGCLIFDMMRKGWKRSGKGPFKPARVLLQVVGSLGSPLGTRDSSSEGLSQIELAAIQARGSPVSAVQTPGWITHAVALQKFRPNWSFWTLFRVLGSTNKQLISRRKY